MRTTQIFFLLSIFLSPLNGHAALARNYSEVKSILQRIAAQNAANAAQIEIGNSDSGEAIVGLKIGNGPINNLVVGTHHGNEYGSTEVALGFADALAKNPILGQTVYVIPVLNIKGFNTRSRNEIVGSQSFDPNRNYPGPCGTEGPFTLKSTAALAKFVEQENIISSATLHTHFPAVVYPWGLSSRDLSTPYQSTFEKLTRDATVESHYEIGNSTEVIYPADGTFEDYAFWKHGIWSILFELGFSHYPSDSEVNTMIQINIPGLRRMLENAPVTRAIDHAFHGQCDALLRSLDRHDE